MCLSISTKCGASRNWHVHRGGIAHPTMLHAAPGFSLWARRLASVGIAHTTMLHAAPDFSLSARRLASTMVHSAPGALAGWALPTVFERGGSRPAVRASLGLLVIPFAKASDDAARHLSHSRHLLPEEKRTPALRDPAFCSLPKSAGAPGTKLSAQRNSGSITPRCTWGMGNRRGAPTYAASNTSVWSIA